ALDLPNARLAPDRKFGGQKFLRHVAASGAWRPWRVPGFACRDTGIAVATNGLAGAAVVRLAEARETPLATHDGEFYFLFVLQGSAKLRCSGSHAIGPGDDIVVPAGMPHALEACSPDLELLEVTLPAAAA